ncbi:hypothetical protein D1BOALGB6SA_8417 [Olavius sp. associated proteobacterium Delta 1]|nr:hypothetical protein D1BOALGB6SA_8417 [Olavius sp. associated proteobacterium Delta 1]
MNMIDEKDPGPESAKADSSEDEVIIDLTDEVIVKTEDDNDDSELSKDMADDAPRTVEDDQASEDADDEEILVLHETDILESPGDETAIDLNDQVAEDQDQIGEDQRIASAIDESLGVDEDETEEVTEVFDLNAPDDDDIIIVDNALDEADEEINAMAGNETAEARRDEDVFDLEEEIELEYESDEDELIDLDDERAEDNQDFVDLMLGVSKESDQSDDDEEPTEYLEFETEEQDDVIVLDAGRDHDTKVIAPTEDETPEFLDSDDLPDLEAIGEFDFESEEEAEDNLAIDEHGTDNSDDIIARTVEQSLDQDDGRELFDPADEAEFGLEGDEAILELDGSPGDDEEILSLTEHGPPTFENDKDLLDRDEEADLEADEEIISLDGFNDLEAENGADIIEITEFDQHFPADGEALLKQSGILDASGADEEDFLELIDVEEDSLSDDEEIVEFSDSPERIENANINQFIRDDLEEDLLKTETPETVFSDDLADKTLENELTESISEDLSDKEFGLDHDVLEVAQEAPDVIAESTPETESPISEDEKFDFDFDHSSIAQQVDRLDTFLSEDAVDESEVASLPVDQVAEEEDTGLEESQIGQGLDELAAVPAGEINAAIERVINEKFSGKIEDIIYEVIEKAVAREIDRLKRALMGNHTIDDNQP